MPNRFKYQNIAVSGRIAVGSTSLVKALSQKLGWNLREGNQIFRDISMQMGFDLEKNIQEAITDRSDQIDLHVDRETTSILEKQSNIVVCSKLAGFLSRDIIHAFKILVTAPPDVRIQRYSRDRGHAMAEAERLIKLREEEDNIKFSRLYGRHNFFDHKYFNLILNSSKLSIEEEAEKVLEVL